jgi:polyisoprenoid-binding protein YceI
MKKVLIIMILLTYSVASFSMKYFTRNGNVRFFSATPIENIVAINNQASCIIDFETGDVVSKMLVEAFQFEKALMQEHFNENYVESDKFPQAVLKGKIVNLKDVNYTKPGINNVLLEADITLHGVTHHYTINGSVENQNGKIIAKAKFIVKPSDFEIKIPKAVENNIAKEVEVTVNFEMGPLNQ